MTASNSTSAQHDHHGGPSRGIIRRIALGDMITRSARVHRNAIALVDGDERMSYAAFEFHANQFAHHLQSTGLQRGDKVAVLASNSVEFLIAAFGILKAAMVWVPINYLLASEDIRYVLEHADVRYVVIDEALYERADLRSVIEQDLRLAAITLKPGRTDAEATALRVATQHLPATEPDVEINDNDLSLIMYTSGTTGKQKGVMHSHLSVHSALMSNVAESALDRHCVCSCILPLFHCAQFAMAGAYLMAGSSVIIFRGFDAKRSLDAIERERITHFTGLPLMYAAMLQEPTRAERDLSSLELCSYGMAPMPKSMLEKLIAEFCPHFTLGTGQTEAFPVTARFRKEEQLRRFGSYWGQATMVNDMAVMDDDGHLLAPGEIGEIVHRGPNIMLGYYKDPEATAAVSRFGWHHTGDMGMFDEDGQLLFLDRKKDVVKTGGENVASVKVEEILMRHPGISNAAVVGLSHVRWGEAVTAFVLIRPGATVEPQEVIDFARQYLAPFETPKHVRVLQEFPMTPTGKIQKHKLRLQFAQLFDDL